MVIISMLLKNAGIEVVGIPASECFGLSQVASGGLWGSRGAMLCRPVVLVCARRALGVSGLVNWNGWREARQCGE